MNWDKTVYEAHSTDYSQEGLGQLVEDHFCILKKLGRGSFGYREALFSLSMIEDEMLLPKGLEVSNLRTVIEEVMISDMENITPGDEDQQKFKRKYSFLIALDITGLMKKFKQHYKNLSLILRNIRYPSLC